MQSNAIDLSEDPASVIALYADTLPRLDPIRRREAVGVLRSYAVLFYHGADEVPAAINHEIDELEERWLSRRN
jgi:hypothetical protein